MDLSTRILIIARPGHSRQSLVALLKTLPQAELFQAEAGALASAQSPHLVIIDLGGLHPLGPETLKRAVQDWPAARVLALVDDIRQVHLANTLGADCVLPHHSTAGELLAAVHQLSQNPPPAYRASAFFPIPAAI